jgi:hypothetical protein
MLILIINTGMMGGMGGGGGPGGMPPGGLAAMMKNPEIMKMAQSTYFNMSALYIISYQQLLYATSA